MSDRLLNGLHQWYAEKLTAHGSSALGVGWNSEERQEILFVQLMRLCQNPQTGKVEQPFSIIDYGCGYGALVPHLAKHGYPVTSYVGYDMMPEMVERAREAGYQAPWARFTSSPEGVTQADYAVASGLIAPKLDADVHEWEKHVLRLLDRLWELGAQGFAVNSLTSYSDAEKMRSDLYYPDPRFLFDHCKRRFSRRVALLHDYLPFDFTLIVRGND